MPQPQFVCPTCAPWIEALKLQVHVLTSNAWQVLKEKATASTRDAKALMKGHKGYWEKQFKGHGTLRFVDGHHAALSSVKERTVFHRHQRHRTTKKDHGRYVPPKKTQ